MYVNFPVFCKTCVEVTPIMLKSSINLCQCFKNYSLRQYLHMWSSWQLVALKSNVLIVEPYFACVVYCSCVFNLKQFTQLLALTLNTGHFTLTVCCRIVQYKLIAGDNVLNCATISKVILKSGGKIVEGSSKWKSSSFFFFQIFLERVY